MPGAVQGDAARAPGRGLSQRRGRSRFTRAPAEPMPRCRGSPAFPERSHGGTPETRTPARRCRGSSDPCATPFTLSLQTKRALQLFGG